MTKPDPQTLMLAARAAELYADSLVKSDSRRYFNTTTGAFVSNVRHAISSIATSLASDSDMDRRNYTLDRLWRLDKDISGLGRAPGKEGSLIDLFNELAQAYRTHCAPVAASISTAAAPSLPPQSGNKNWWPRPTGISDLGWAARRSQLGEVIKLLGDGADPNDGDPSPLMEAIGHGYDRPTETLAIIRELLNAGADVNYVSRNAGTALTTLARFGAGSTTAAAIADELLARGADTSLGSVDKVSRLTTFLNDIGRGPGPEVAP